LAIVSVGRNIAGRDAPTNPTALVTPDGATRAVPPLPGRDPLWVTSMAGTEDGFLVIGWDCSPVDADEADDAGCGEGALRALSYDIEDGWREIDGVPDELSSGGSAISDGGSVVSFPSGRGLVRYDLDTDRWTVTPLATSGQLGGCDSAAGLLTVGFEPSAQGLGEEALVVEREDGRTVAVGVVTSPKIVCASQGEGLALVATVGPSVYIAADDLEVTPLPALAEATGRGINDLANGASLIDDQVRIVTYTPGNEPDSDVGKIAAIDVSNPAIWSVEPATTTWAAADVKAASVEPDRTVAVIAIRVAGDTDGRIDHYEVVVTG
jgi:hypothetical protein